MSQDRIIVAVDSGSTKVCTTVSRAAEDGTLALLGYGVVKSQGFRKGSVVDLQQAQDVMRESVQDASHSSGLQIHGVYLSVTGPQMKSLVTRGDTPLNSRGPITRADVVRAEQSSHDHLNGSSGDVIHSVPLEYAVDGHPTYEPLESLRGLRLAVSTHFVTCPSNAVWNLRKAAQAAGVEVRGLVAEAIASGEAVLTDEEKERGVVVIDIGGAPTDIAIFYDSKPVFTAVLPVGGWQLTNDIAMGLDAPFTTAEDVKVRRGTIYPDKGEPFTIPSVGKQRERIVTDIQLSGLMKERMGEILRYALMSLDGAPRHYPLPAGIVFTGGSSKVTGLSTLAESIFGLKSRVGRPAGIRYLPEDLDQPEFATSFGVPLWVVREEQRRTLEASGGADDGTVAGKMRGWIKSVFQVA